MWRLANPLIVIALAMSSNKTWHEWEDAVNSLEKIAMKMWSKRIDPFPLLKISYDRLPSEYEKVLHLLLSAYPLLVGHGFDRGI